MKGKRVLVTGATGYVGGRLVPRLLSKGYRVRAMARNPEKVEARGWGRDPGLAIVPGDVLDRASLQRAARGCSVAFYLVHSMTAAGRRYREADMRGALNMAAAAEAEGVGRIIYLGGLGEATPYRKLSRHLMSRHEVGRVLREGAVPATCLRAAMILGSGSASFEILRYLVDRLPVMTPPRWVDTRCQPIAITNVLGYLEGCLEHPETTGETYDIGGPDVLTYRKLLDIYASEARLWRRWVIPVPLLSTTLSAWWIAMATPLPAALAVPLIQGLKVPVVCRENRIRRIVPQELLSCRKSIRMALDTASQERAESRHLDSPEPCPAEWTVCGDAGYAGGTIMQRGMTALFPAAEGKVWEAVIVGGREIGGYFGDFLRPFSGRRKNAAPPDGPDGGARLGVGEAIGFWRVAEVDPPHRLLLHRETPLPGEVFLEFRIAAAGEGQSRLTLLSRYFPRGLSGILWGGGFSAIRHPVLRGIIRSLARTMRKPVIGPLEPIVRIPNTACRKP